METDEEDGKCANQKIKGEIKKGKRRIKRQNRRERRRGKLNFPSDFFSFLSFSDNLSLLDLPLLLPSFLF